MSDPEAELETFIDRFTPVIAARARACRSALRKRLPTAIELVYDNYNALAVGYASGERLRDALVSLAIYPRNVALYFVDGASLPDPSRRLSGTGSKGRHIRFTGPELLADPAVEALIRAAETHAGREWPTPPDGGYTVIKSVSARQRPRRPREEA